MGAIKRFRTSATMVTAFTAMAGILPTLRTLRAAAPALAATPTLVPRGRRSAPLLERRFAFRWLSGCLLAFALLVLAPVGSAQAAAIVHPDGCAAQTLPRNDDGSTSEVALGFDLNFFGDTYSSLYVNNNGNVTFGGPLGTYTPFGLTTNTAVPIIAAFFGDVDTRGSGSAEATYGQTTYAGRPAFCANWDGVGVGYFSHGVDKLNKFQILLVERSDTGAGNFDVHLNYDQIQWETGSASGGSGGLGGQSAHAGYSNGSGLDGTFFELEGSGVNGAFLDSNPDTGLVHNSRASLQNGRYIFEVRNGQAPTGGRIYGTVTGSGPAANAPVQVCPQNPAAGACIVTQTNSFGRYSASGLAPGQYDITANPPAGDSDHLPTTVADIDLALGQARNLDIQLRGANSPPQDTTLTSIGTASGGVPVVYWNQQLTLTTRGCEGGQAHYQIIRDGTVIREGDMTPVAGDPGGYSASIDPLVPTSGVVTFRLTVTGCPDPADDEEDSFNVYIDPSGFVRTTGGAPIEGATVTLLRSDTAAGPFVEVPDGSSIMSPSNRQNPDQTDATGHFGWDVIAGYYIVRAQKEGCRAPGDSGQQYVESRVMEIPPPVTDLDLRLDCGNEDVTAPVVTVPATITQEATGPTGAAVAFSASAQDDVDGAVPVTCTPDSGSTFGLGTTAVECRASDAAGNTATASFSIVVVDTAAPTLTVPGDRSVRATSPAGAQVSYSASASDAVDETPTMACTPPSGSTFAINQALDAATTVTCTATDDSGNSSSASFRVHVKGAREQISDLISLVRSFGLHHGIENSLNAKLNAALEAIDSGATATACASLSDFINHVRAQAGKKLTADQAGQLTADAQQIRRVLGC